MGQLQRRPTEKTVSGSSVIAYTRCYNAILALQGATLIGVLSKGAYTALAIGYVIILFLCLEHAYIKLKTNLQRLWSLTGIAVNIFVLYAFAGQHGISGGIILLYLLVLLFTYIGVRRYWGRW